MQAYMAFMIRASMQRSHNAYGTTVTLSIGAYGWWMREHPVLPANDSINFAVHTTKNGAIMSRIKVLSSNVETGLVWGRLDVVLRVGESTMTADDPERGVLVMDRPRLVTDLSYSKLYI